MQVGGNVRRRWRLVALAATLPLALLVMPAAGSNPAANAHFSVAGTVALPGRGLSLAWSPAGDAIAAGGHFREAATNRRYDTRTIDARGLKLAKSFDCHYWWTVSQAWSRNPYIGEVIADGAGDHAVKIWNANAPGSSSCSRGQFRATDGAVHALYNINGWVTSLAFSPDGRFLAGASRDRTIRIWQLTPGPDQWEVVRLWYDKSAKNFLSVRWSPDGHRILTGDRSGRVAEWSFDPVADRWSEAMITAYANLGWSGQPQWFAQHAALLGRMPLWSESGHQQVWNARYSPDGMRVAAAGTDGSLSVFAARTGRVLYRAHAPSNSALYGLDWSPDGALVAAGAGDHAIYVFNAADGSLYDKLVGHATLVTAVAWSPNGRTLASTAGGQLLSEALNDVIVGPDDAVHLWARH